MSPPSPNPKFESPPITELVIAAYFHPPLAGLRSEHIGLFWSRIRDAFPTVEQQAPVGAELLEPIGNELFPMPRFWFISADGSNLIQLQKNAFMLNWRRGNGAYPHFAKQLKPAFDKYFRIFEDFAREDASVEKLTIQRCELTYFNTIEPCEYWSGPQDTAKVIPSFIVPNSGAKASLDSSPAFNCTYVYSLAKDLELRVNLKTGESNTQQGTPLLIFEIRATGRISGGPSAADAWYERAHNAVIECFLGMTSNAIQDTYWKRIPDSQ